jgi:hypothetical protein
MAIIGEAGAISIHYNPLMFIEESNGMCSPSITDTLSRLPKF